MITVSWLDLVLLNLTCRVVSYYKSYKVSTIYTTSFGLVQHNIAHLDGHLIYSCDKMEMLSPCTNFTNIFSWTVKQKVGSFSI